MQYGVAMKRLCVGCMVATANIISIGKAYERSLKGAIRVRRTCMKTPKKTTLKLRDENERAERRAVERG